MFGVSLYCAVEFLNHRGLLAPDGTKKLYSNKDQFYQYVNNQWILKTIEDIQDDIIQLALTNKDFRNAMHEESPRDVARYLKSVCKNSDLRVGYLVDGWKEDKSHYIPLQNGVLKLNLDGKVLHKTFQPPMQGLFNTYILPYTYEPESKCERFFSFLTDILSEEEVRLVQEWFGYCLIPVNLANKLMIFFGAGANGKSVILLVLKLVLGEDNVSCIPLQSFLPESRFGLAATEGKLANIAEEIDENINAASGILKQFTGGDSVPVERKYKEGFLIKPTARLIFGTNALPRFKDESDGLFRRMIILPFSKQFLDESKQDKNLINKDFWIESGELSGIFNWALEGLERLISNNWKFTQPQSVSDTLESYRITVNPIIQFLKDYLEPDITGKITVVELYQKYSEHCKTFGISKAEASAFGRNVKRVYPHVTQSPNALVVGKIRTRVWYGLRFQSNEFNNSPFLNSTQETQANQEKTSFQATSIELKEEL